VNDCWDALKWAVANAQDLKATPQKGLIVGGSSAGGNIAAVLALLSRDENLQPPITGQYLSVPALLPSTDVPEYLRHLYTSRTDNVDDPVLGKLDEPSLLTIYQPEQRNPLWDPFNHPRGHRGVAKAFFQVGGLDPLRDEAVLYYWRLRESKVQTRFDLYKGYGHMFWTNWPELEESRKFVADTLTGVKWLLEP
jgi:acetyl esterase/lipase